MRADDLIGRRVHAPGGGRRRYVIDVRTRAEDGRLVVDGLIVGRHHWRMFGYEHRREHGPILMRRIVETLHRDTRYAPWGDLELDGDTVRLTRDWDDLPHLPGLDASQG
jgi:hypothetical protein